MIFLDKNISHLIFAQALFIKLMSQVLQNVKLFCNSEYYF